VRERHTERERERHTHSERETHTERERETHTHTVRETKRPKVLHLCEYFCFLKVNTSILI